MSETASEIDVLRAALVAAEARGSVAEGALVAAKDELTQGTNPEVKKLAQAVIDGQSAEIAEMRSSL